MFCPECGEEYRPGFDMCADCGVPLVAERPEPGPEKDRHNIELSTVLETSDAGLIAVAKSLLETAEIPFVVRGENIQDLFGAGRFPGNINVLVGPVELQVDAQDKGEALAILEDLIKDSLRGEEPANDEEV
jgi:hypothetical protein